MRDNNDNNVDDNLENMAMLGGLLNLQGQQQAHQQRTKQSQELQRLSRIAERARAQEAQARKQEAQARKREAQARVAEESRIKRLPQCPACGARLEGQFRKCMHCASDLAWIEGIPCELGKEHEVRERLRNEREQALRRKKALKQRRLQLDKESKQIRLQIEKERQQKWEKLQSEMDQLTNGLPDNCPKCSHSRPGYSLPQPSGHIHDDYYLEYAGKWVQTSSQHGCCPECRQQDIALQEKRLQVDVALRESKKQKIEQIIGACCLIVFIVFVFIVIGRMASSDIPR